MMKQQLAGLIDQPGGAGQHEEDAGATVPGRGRGPVGSGLVKVTIDLRNDVKRIAIDRACSADDKDMLEDLIVAAMNDALRKAEQTASEKMGSVTAGLPLPPGFKMPF